MQNQALAVSHRTSTGIDALRGGFALLVLVSHAWGAAVLSAEIQPAAGLLGFLQDTIGHGGFWVNGFFVLSGFCIHLSIINARAQQRYTAAGYALARWTRIYPTFLLAFGFALLVAWISQRFAVPEPQSINLPQTIGTLFLLQAFTGTVACFGQSWSITYEAIYYLAWPFLLHWGKYSGRVATLWGVLVASAITVVAVVIWKFLAAGSPQSPWILGWTIPAASLLWLAGAFLAETWGKLGWFHRNCRWSLAIACIGLIAAYLVEGWLISRGSRSALLFGASLISGPFFCLLIVGCDALPLPPWSGQFVKKFSGDLSYPLYLLHGPAILLWLCVLQACDERPPFPLLFLENLSFGLLIALGAGLPFERAFLFWRRKWLNDIAAPSLRMTEEVTG